MKPFYSLLCAAVMIMAATSCSKTDALKPAPVPELALSGSILNGTVTATTQILVTTPYMDRASALVTVSNQTGSVLWIMHISSYIKGLSGNLVGFHYYGPEEGGTMCLASGQTMSFGLQILPLESGGTDPYVDLKKLIYGHTYNGETTVIGSLGGTAPSRPNQYRSTFTFTTPPQP